MGESETGDGEVRWAGPRDRETWGRRGHSMFEKCKQKASMSGGHGVRMPVREEEAEAKSIVVDHDEEFGLNPKSNGKQPLTNIKQKGVPHADFSLSRSTRRITWRGRGKAG